MGVSATTARRAGRDSGLKPQLSRTSKDSGDPPFEDQMLDVAGLQLNPTEHAPRA